MMESRALDQFLQFLRRDLAIPDASVQLALRHREQTPSGHCLLVGIAHPTRNALSIIAELIVTLTQLNQMFD
jgi:Protein of unknown function (DUF2949)